MMGLMRDGPTNLGFHLAETKATLIRKDSETADYLATSILKAWSKASDLAVWMVEKLARLKQKVWLTAGCWDDY